MSVRRLAATAPLGLALAALLVPHTATAEPGPPNEPKLVPSYLTSTVVEGSLDGTPGNRHQIVVDRSQRDSVGGWVRSWTCPDDATVTMSWVSSRCDHRLTQTLRDQYGTSADEWLSSTGRSATVSAPNLVGVNRATGYVRRLPLELTFVAGQDATLTQEVNSYTYSPARVRGEIGGARYADSDGYVGYRIVSG